MKRFTLLSSISYLLIFPLLGCSEQEAILSGEREPIFSVFQDSAVLEDERPANRQLAFKAPKLHQNLDWPQGHATSKTRTTNVFLATELKLRWSISIGTGDVARARLTVDPISKNGTIFTLDSQMVLTSTSKTGVRHWTKDLTPPIEESGQADGGGLATGGGMLFASTGYGELWALDPKSGQNIWRQSLLGTGNSQPVYFDGLVYLVSNDATSWAIEAKTGLIRWQIDGLADTNNVMGTTGPSVSDKLVVFGFGSGEVQAAFRQGGLVLWTATLAGGRLGQSVATVEDIGSTPVISGRSVYVANTSGRMVALNRDSGERLWSAPYGTRSLIWPAGGSVFFINDLSELIRLDASTGDFIWATKLPGYLDKGSNRTKEIVAHHGPILAGGQLIIASSDGKLRQFDPTSGDELRSFRIPGGATTAPIVADGTLYVVSKQGELHAFR
ncbi:MAG: PQQ-binding-like beta-propeller repeat protein [Paracoccaceae bacterium]|nr:PQQ-binding-like beta-propeller repeat protein [Paracoccaceae bacterium]